MDKIKKLFAASAVTAVTVMAAPSVFAAEGGWDLSNLASTIDFSTVAGAILGVAGAAALAHVGMKGAKWVLGFIKTA